MPLILDSTLTPETARDPIIQGLRVLYAFKRSFRTTDDGRPIRQILETGPEENPVFQEVNQWFRTAFIDENDIDEDLDLRDDHIAGAWRVLVKSDANTTVAVTLDKDSDGNWKFGQINRGPFVSGTVRAWEIAEDFIANENRAEAREPGGVISSSYEAFFLNVPSLYVTALWLKNLNGRSRHDHVIVMPPAPAEFRPGEVTASGDFAKRLYELWQREREVAGDF